MYHDNLAQVHPQEQQDHSTKGKAVKIRQTYLTIRGSDRAGHGMLRGRGSFMNIAKKATPLSPFETFHSLPL